MNTSIPHIHEVELRPFGSQLARLSKDKSTLFIPLPGHSRIPISGGCQCDHCAANPHLVPCWDTLAVPVSGGWTSTVHNPQLKP